MRYLMAALAFVTCPCHLPILLVVLGGTTFGAVLAEHVGLTVAILSVAFVGSLWGAIRLFSKVKQDRSGTAR